MNISVIVTNWNGLDLLKKNLETIIKLSPEAKEIIVADDSSEDGSVKYLKSLQKKYKKLKIISHKINLGFAKNSNYAVKKSRGDLVVLLNNDIVPQKNYIKPALKHFSDPKIFGVGFSELETKNWARIYWQDGYLQHEPKQSNTAHISAWLSGGSSIIRKEYFLRLAGFDPIYKPFYSEDLDLGYRAWKSGYKIIWEPKCMVSHQHEATMSRFPKRFSDYVKERNRLLTVWRNITDPKLLRQNRLAIIGRVIFGPNYIKIIRAAKKQIHSHPKPIIFPVLSDQQILDMFKS